jgi:hypothetical protein
MACKRPSKRAPAPTRQNVVPIHKLPRHIKRLPVADALAWVVEATQLTPYQVLTHPHLVRERLLIALTRERRATADSVPAQSHRARPPAMPDLLAALDAFLQEHRRCGDLDAGVDGGRVWMACDCGAGITHPVEPTEPACPER